MTRALEVTVTAPVVSFRNPLYAGVQVGLPCPPPATVGGMLAAVAGSWGRVDPGLRFGAAFVARGSGTDLETYHPALGNGKRGDPVPKDRDFLADVELTLWLPGDVGDVDAWRRRLRRPASAPKLGRSQDLAHARAGIVELDTGPGRQGHALLPGDATQAGTLLQLPTAVSYDRARTRWDPYRYAARGADVEIQRPDFVTAGGQAVVLLPPVHPGQFAAGSAA